MNSLRLLWCLLMHRRHHHRTGERRLHTVSIAYERFCTRCCLDVPSELVWLIE